MVHLHVHSNYSLLGGGSTVQALVERARATGMTALALTDHDGLYGAVRFYQAATAAGVRPILGVEMTLEASPEGRRQKAVGSPDEENAESSADSLSRLPTAFCLLPSGPHL